MPPQLIQTALMKVARKELGEFGQLPLHAKRHLLDVRHSKPRIALQTARRQDSFASAAQRIRKAWIAYNQICLPAPVYSQGLLESIGAKPVVEDSRSGAKRRLAILEWRPGDAEARSKVVAIPEVGLELVAQPEAHR